MPSTESSIKIKKIFVPIDYSEYSIHACRYAMLIAAKANAKILIYHAFWSPAFDLIELSGNKSAQKNLREEVTEELSVKEQDHMNTFYESLKTCQEYKLLNKQQIKTQVSPGLAKQTISELCDSYQPSLVVMGANGKTDQETTLLGSITAYVIKRLPFPVLAVPANNSSAINTSMKRILFLTDFDESDFLSIKKLMGFTNLMNMSIFCLHVGSKAGNWEKIKMEGLKAYFKTVYDTVKVECDILPVMDNKMNSIEQYIKENEIDIISLTTRKRNLLEKYFKPNLTKKLFYNISTPFLVFHS